MNHNCHLQLHHINYRRDKELFDQVDRRFSRQQLQREGGGEGSRITIDDLTQDQRVALAKDYLREHSFMHVSDYAQITGLSRSSAQRELSELVKYEKYGIAFRGRGSHRVYVLRTGQW